MSRGLLPAVCVLLAGTRTPAQERRYSLSVDHGGGIDAVRDFRLRRNDERAGPPRAEPPAAEPPAAEGLAELEDLAVPYEIANAPGCMPGTGEPQLFYLLREEDQFPTLALSAAAYRLTYSATTLTECKARCKRDRLCTCIQHKASEQVCVLILGHCPGQPRIPFTTGQCPTWDTQWCTYRRYCSPRCGTSNWTDVVGFIGTNQGAQPVPVKCGRCKALVSASDTGANRSCQEYCQSQSSSLHCRAVYEAVDNTCEPSRRLDCSTRGAAGDAFLCECTAYPCTPSQWVDAGRKCGVNANPSTCKVVAGQMKTGEYATCSAFCQTHGTTCVAAREAAPGSCTAAAGQTSQLTCLSDAAALTIQSLVCECAPLVGSATCNVSAWDIRRDCGNCSALINNVRRGKYRHCDDYCAAQQVLSTGGLKCANAWVSADDTCTHSTFTSCGAPADLLGTSELICECEPPPPLCGAASWVDKRTDCPGSRTTTCRAQATNMQVYRNCTAYCRAQEGGLSCIAAAIVDPIALCLARRSATCMEDAGNETEMLCECDSAAPEEDCAVDTWTDVLNGRQACSTCAAVASGMQDAGKTCASFCAQQNKTCVAARRPVFDSSLPSCIAEHYSLGCDESAGLSHAICECAAEGVACPYDYGVLSTRDCVGPTAPLSFLPRDYWIPPP